MRGRWVRVSGVVVAFFFAACGDDDVVTDGGGVDGAMADAAVDGGPRGAVARFDPSDGAAMGFGDVPFPHDLYFGADGKVALDTLPIQGASSAGLDAALEGVRRQTGSARPAGHTSTSTVRSTRRWCRARRRRTRTRRS
jgi:hypothetical protein